MTRVSLGAQSFQPQLLEVLERRARPDDVRRAFAVLREAGFDNLSLDLIYGIPGQSAADLDADLSEALALGAGARLRLRARGEAGDAVHARARRGARAPGRGDGVVLRAGRRPADRGRLPLVRDGELLPRRASRDLRSRHNLAYWRGRDYLGLGIGAVSTIDGRALADDAAARALPRRAAGRRAAAARARGAAAAGAALRARAARPAARRAARRSTASSDALDAGGRRAARAARARRTKATGSLSLTERGRFLGGGVTAELLA